MTASLPRILMVEDDPDFAFLVKRAFGKAEVAAHLDVVGDGEAALAYLKASPSRPPALVLLDLKLPKLFGFQVLSRLRQDPQLPGLPVVVLTSSGQDRDREEARNLGADDFKVKPPSYQDLIRLLGEVAARWLPASHRGS
jgi:CheY-like chemotaxis protein